MPGLMIDLAEFALDGSLTDDVATARFPFLPADEVSIGLAAARSTNGIDDDLRPFLEARAETAAAMWSAHDGSVRRAITGAVDALASATQPLAVSYRALALPDEMPARLHHLLTGLRYERLGAHVEACDRAGLERDDAEVLSAAWATQWVDDAPERLTDLGLLDADGGITADGRELRDRIESETDAGCESMWASIADLDGWISALSALR